MSAQTYAGPILVTCAYFAVYYAMMIIGAKTKSRLFAEYSARGEKFDRYFGKDREMLAADRMMLNMLEHMGPFIVLMWLHAVFFSVGSATVAGAIYVASRAAYRAHGETSRPTDWEEDSASHGARLPRRRLFDGRHGLRGIGGLTPRCHL